VSEAPATGLVWTCNLCKRSPAKPEDQTYQWCDFCLGYTDAPILQPDQFHYVNFSGGPHNTMHRYVEMRTLRVGDEWAPVSGSPAVYRWDGTQYVYVRG
jgi:hypothetical protein